MLPNWRSLVGVAVALVMLCSLPAWALSESLPAQTGQPGQKGLSSETVSSVVIATRKIDYTVTTGRLPVTDMTGKAKANIFYIAYTKMGEAKPASRPLTFCFNGGPGASSSYVHLAAFGPRCVLIDEDGKGIPTPARLVDNEHSLLDATDLVFIDP